MNSNAVIAKKRFGQNFLKDVSVLHRIIQSMPNNNNKVVEIGPGLGDLTKYLVDVKSVEAFEVDTELCKILQDKFKDEINTKQFQLHCGDVLNVWQTSSDECLIKESYDLVANLPYYIATNIILKALADPMCKNILVMTQLEVAEKFCASAGEKVFGSLGIITQSVGTARIIVKVPPTAFEPPPKINSAVFLIQKDKNRRDKEFEDMLRIAFTQPRKTLLKNLSSKYDKTELLHIFEELNFTLTIRPHQVSTSDYHHLYKKII